jgi:polyhydroxyalkanoate synthesis regulator protein
MTVSVKYPPILIKRYADGRLYDTVALRYLSLEDLRFWKARAIAFIVIDAETGEDVTLTLLA